METRKRIWLVHRPFYGYLCYIGGLCGELGFATEEEIGKKGHIPVLFRSKREAECWKNRVASYKGWLFTYETEAVAFEVAVERI